MSLTYNQAVEQTITAGEQIHQIVNGTATTEVTVEDGSKVPSIRKALLDNFYFKDPIAWQVGQTENVFNQLRQFTDGSWWYAPSATASNPISMGSTPVGDPLWKIYDFDAIGKLEPRIDEALYRSYAEAGYNVVGTFQEGFTYVNTNDVGIDKATGKGYTGPAGTVAAGTDPTSGGFVDVSQISYKNARALSDAVNRSITAKASDFVSILDFEGVVPGLDSTAGLKKAFASGLPLYVPAGTYLVSDTLVGNNITLVGESKDRAVFQAVAALNAPVIKLTNGAANTDTQNILHSIGVIGNDDATKTDQVGVLVDKGAGAASAQIVNCRIFRNGSDGVRIKTGVHCDLLFNELWRNRRGGLTINPTGLGNFANVIRAHGNRIKHNWMGVILSRFDNIGFLSAPSTATSIEMSGLVITENLIENNTNSNDNSNWFDYTDRLGTITRPGVGVLAEGLTSSNISNNWIEQHYQDVRLNGLNKSNKIKLNKFGYKSNFNAAIQGTGADMLCAIILASYATGTIWNEANEIDENTFTDKNGYSGGAYEGMHVISTGGLNRGGSFQMNFADSENANGKNPNISPELIPLNFVKKYMRADPNNLSIEENLRRKFANVTIEESLARITLKSTGVGKTFQTSDTANAGSSDFTHELNFVSTQYSQNKGAIGFAADRTSTSANAPYLLITTRSPEGFSAYPVGSIAMVNNATVGVGGVWVKESGGSTVNGWVKK